MSFTLNSINPLDPRLLQVLEYWLGSEKPDNASALARKDLWFKKSEEVDEEIRNRFGAVMQEALAGRLDGEAGTPLGRLSLIIVLDQFMRNSHRGDAKSFAGDPKALQLALDGIAQGHDTDDSVPPVARIFYYLPLEHAEDLTMQQHSVVAFEQLAQEATPDTQAFFDGTLDYAHRHFDVIKQFGRFPHRNAVLGRSNTPEEKTYLAQPGAGF